MTDLLNMTYINSLPQPFWVRELGDKDFIWPVYDIDVETGLYRIDVCGKLDVRDFGEAVEFKDADGAVHDAETFYSDYEPGEGVNHGT